MIEELSKEWNSFSRYQKIILSIYFLISLPLQPFLIWMIPLAHWVTSGQGVPYKRITLMEFLPMSIAMAMYGYLIGLLIYCNK